MKYKRHAKILDIINNNIIETQDDLAQKLLDAGLDFTQATISRDIKELQLIKVSAGNGRYKYAARDEKTSELMDRLMTIFAYSVVSIDYSLNNVVVKTLPAMAQAAASGIDALGWNEILGTIAGDDTILIICRGEEKAKNITTRFERLRKEAGGF
jgi:transcriptional regulator of arginine metabolism